MKAFLAGVKRWYLRRFKGIVKPPAHAKGQGTTWQQWPGWRTTFLCRCGYQGDFSPDTYVILSQDHVDGCDGIGMQDRPHARCDCPVSEARYVKICPQCRMGHWKQAK